MAAPLARGSSKGTIWELGSSQPGRSAWELVPTSIGLRARVDFARRRLFLQRLYKADEPILGRWERIRARSGESSSPAHNAERFATCNAPGEPPHCDLDRAGARIEFCATGVVALGPAVDLGCRGGAARRALVASEFRRPDRRYAVGTPLHLRPYMASTENGGSLRMDLL